MIDIAAAAILTSIYKLAEEAGGIEYIKKLPEKAVDALYQKLVKDSVFENSSLQQLFHPEVAELRKVLEKAGSK